MKKTYEAPEIEIQVLVSSEDILVVSGGQTSAGGVTDNEGNWSEWL